MLLARAIILASLAATPAAAPATHAEATAALRLIATRPVQVRATGFAPDERVRLTARIAGEATRTTATADRRGTFTASVPGAVASRCATLVVTASGIDGSHAVVRRSPKCAVRGS